MTIDFDLVDYCTPEDWREWQRLVTQEEWTALDHTVFAMYPNWHAVKVSVAKRKNDGSFLGSVVCVEQEGLCILDTYILVEEARGKGIGSKLWKYALDKRNKELILVLRSVPEMVERYMSTDLPIRGEDQFLFSTTISQLMEILKSIPSSTSQKKFFKRVDDLSDDQFERLLKFDVKVTGRNRKRFLTELFGQPNLMTGVLLDEREEVRGYSAIVPTCGRNLFRIAPLYANCLEDVSALLQPLLKQLQMSNCPAEIHTYFIEKTRGFDEFLPVFERFGAEKELLGTTLFSRPYQNPTNTEFVYVAHDNFLHFDL